MGYRVSQRAHGTWKEQYGERRGLEGPFKYPNGRVLYYDPKEGEYWDPRTDWYVLRDELATLQNTFFELLKK